MDQQRLSALLSAAVKYGASDIHLQAMLPPAFRVKGDLMSVKHPPLTDADLQAIFHLTVRESELKQKIDTVQELDGSFELKGICRFRYNFFRNRGRLGVILRVITSVVPTIETLKLPPVMKTIAKMQRGLVLVTGATGSGKSTTLAAIIDYINEKFPYHILTIEDPIEFVHSPKKARITQRELGRDTSKFSTALKYALRQDPDVILVGEMRDAETIDIALQAAETGHLVFSTVHTNDAIRTIGRLIAVFPPEEQHFIRLRLAENLMATVSQRLIKKADGSGLIAAQEIMIANRAIQDCIRDPAHTNEINDYIARSSEVSGGQTFDQHLSELYRKNLITLEDAMEAASSGSDFQRNVMYSNSTVVETESGGDQTRKLSPGDQSDDNEAA